MKYILIYFLFLLGNDIALAQSPFHFVKRFNSIGETSEGINAYDTFNSLMFNDSIIYTSELNGNSVGNFPNDRFYTFRKINSNSGFQYSQNSFSDSCSYSIFDSITSFNPFAIYMNNNSINLVGTYGDNNANQIVSGRKYQTDLNLNI
jgi:hypothetical protein